jgi:F0F1-type ATP synthase membrane subunit b/b'
MRRWALTALAGCLLVCSPVTAQTEGREKQSAESKGAEEGNPIWAWLNFLLLAGGLGYLAKKHAGPYFARRSVEIRKEMIEAKQARAEADAKAADVDRRLAGLKADIEALRAEAAREGKSEAARHERETESELAKIAQQTADEVAAAGKAARMELRRYAAHLALELAEHQIQARMSPEIQDRMTRIFAEHIAETARNN